MSPFAFSSQRTTDAAIQRMAAADRAMYIAGGTDMLQLLQEAIVEPRELIHIGGLPLTGITHGKDAVRIGALTRLADVIADSAVTEYLPALCQALRATASPQVRNMATMGGNLLQRTRCLYYRDAASPCNKRNPGSGCPARDSGSRMNAVLGVSENCVATYPGDLAVALVALNASVSVVGPAGPRGIPVEDLHRLPGDTPERDTCLLPGELITEIVVPSSGRSLFMKLRDRASFEWALASAAISFEISNGLVSEARVAVGGLAAKPWRLTQVEELLVGRRIDAGLAGDAGTAAIADARPTHGAEFKVTLLRRLVERIVLAAGGIE